MDLHDVSSALFFWRKSVQIRHEGAFRQYPKPDTGKHPVLDAREFDSHEELEQMMDSSHALKMQVSELGLEPVALSSLQAFTEDAVPLFIRSLYYFIMVSAKPSID